MRGREKKTENYIEAGRIPVCACRIVKITYIDKFGS